MKKMHGFIGMTVRVCAFVVVLGLPSVALTGCEYLDQMLGGMGLGGGVEGVPEADPGGTGQQPEQPEQPAGQMATGGAVTTIEGEDGNTYEVHTFKEVGTYALTFSEDRESVRADYLIVAGGGGAGGNRSDHDSDRSGGGGAGGLLYEAERDLTLTNNVVTVIVGKGGAGGVNQNKGENGGDSSIGTTIVVDGGGGGGGYTLSGDPGNDGGSGGGGGAGGGSDTGSPGAHIGEGIGHRGGTAGGTAGGGGGGAGNVGGDGGSDGNAPSGTGGPGWKASQNNAAWLNEALNANDYEFSRGGKGGANRPDEEGDGPGVNYGDGGSGSNEFGEAGSSGQSGIVIIRFLRPSS